MTKDKSENSNDLDLYGQKNLLLNLKIEEKEKVLCNFCKRTLTNGIGCKGICVSINEY